jgi:hypothetical protein
MEVPGRLIRWAQYALLVVAIVGACLPSLAVGVSHYDGSYVGTIECDQIPGYTRGPLKREFTLQIAGGRAQYARPLILPPTRLLATGLDPTERGTGTVSSTGEVSLTGEAGDLTGGFEATYRGQIDGKLLRLSGVQVWQLPDKANYKRSCTIVVSRSE